MPPGRENERQGGTRGKDVTLSKMMKDETTKDEENLYCLHNFFGEIKNASVSIHRRLGRVLSAVQLAHVNEGNQRLIIG